MRKEDNRDFDGTNYELEHELDKVSEMKTIYVKFKGTDLIITYYIHENGALELTKAETMDGKDYPITLDLEDALWNSIY